MEYLPFIKLMEACYLILTDSGGIQEECNWFNKVCFVCREVTERQSDNSVMCKTPKSYLKTLGIWSNAKEISLAILVTDLQRRK